MLSKEFRFPIARPWLCRKNLLIPLYFDVSELVNHPKREITNGL
jgi:hypothetical protein